MAPPRRSARARREVQSYYKDAKQQEDESLALKRSYPEETEDRTDDDEIITDPSSSSESESSDEEEEKQVTVAEKPARATQRSTTNAPVRARNIKIRNKMETGIKAKPRPKTTTSRAATIKSALAALRRKVLLQDETPETSLTAALLQSHLPGQKTNKLRTKQTPYTPYLEKMAQDVLREHREDPNQAQVKLLNLLFRSVGCQVQRLVPSDMVLDDASDEDWEEMITEITSSMQQTTPDKVLLSADPSGVGGGGKSGSVAIREYRKIYEEFWYMLGIVALTDHVDRNGKDNDDDDDTDMEEEQGQTTSRFQVELTRDILARMVEMVSVSQPDIRAGSTIAVYQLSQAIMDVAVELSEKLDVAKRQHKAAQRSKSDVKADALQNQIKSWKRIIDELESIITTTTIETVFLKRYRDRNPHIRAASLDAMSSLILTCPDKLCKPIYLKYFYWMLSDKEAKVRLSAMSSLMAPFRLAADKASGKSIDLQQLNSIVEKMLPRLADCVLDVDLEVQERAIEFLLILLRQDFLATLGDDSVWEQINLRALAQDTTPLVRREALYFVLEQLESFQSGSVNTDEKIMERIDEIAQWLVHSLADGDLPVEDIRFDLVDLVVGSLRSMEEHCRLVTSWTAMLRILGKDAVPPDSDSRRADAVKQRVVLRMLVCAAELEVRDTARGGFASSYMDEDLVAARNALLENFEPVKKKRKSISTAQEELTVALARALPELMSAYKGEAFVMRDLTLLPQYFVPSVFALPSRKNDFTKLIRILSEVLSESTASEVVNNCAFALVSLARCNHARTGEALLQLKKTASRLRDRLFNLIDDKSEPSLGTGDSTAIGDIQHAKCFCLRRLNALAKRWDLEDLFGGDADDLQGEKDLEVLCDSIAADVTRALQCRRIIETLESDDGESILPEIWGISDERVHAYLADTVKEALTFLLSAAAWKLGKEIKRIEQVEAEMYEDYSDHIVVRLRDRVRDLTLLCFEEYAPQAVGNDHVELQRLFEYSVHTHAVAAAGDLRMLFPEQWAMADHSFLQACALTDIKMVIGGTMKIYGSQLEMGANINDGRFCDSLLLPMARAVACNWKTGNRREAARILRQITGSRAESQELVSSLYRALKKIDSIRLLEAQMTAIQYAYEEWSISEPDELENDRPTEEEISAYEHAMQEHSRQFEAVKGLAARLSSYLGVGKLQESKLSQGMVQFIEEGIRFAFSTDEDEEEPTLGIRLPFLFVISKYLSWVRRDTEATKAIRRAFDAKESKLRLHPDYDELGEFELSCIAEFRNAANIGKLAGAKSARASAATQADVSSTGGTPSYYSPQHSRLSGNQSVYSRSTLGQTQQGSSDQESVSFAHSHDEGSLSPAKSRRSESIFSGNHNESPQSFDDDN